MNSDRWFFAMLLASLAGHATLLAAERLMPGWGSWTQSLKPLKLVYEPQSPQERFQAARLSGDDPSLRASLPQPSAGQLLGDSAGGFAARSREIGLDAALVSQVTVGNLLGGGSAGIAARGSWDTAVDLTNLAEAAQGNPVLYTYFSAIREQIQQTANGQTWLPQEMAEAGAIYVGFVLGRRGEIQSAGVVSERSADSSLLRQAALRIVKASGPFVAFPPSFKEESMAIVVPIEFSFTSE